MDLNQPGSNAVAGRTEAFYDGTNGTPNMVASGLAEESAQFNDKVGKTLLAPHSVLQGFSGMSGNGMSADDAERILPGGYQMPSSNGSSTESYNAARMMRMLSGSEV